MKISIITATYNSGATLRDTLESVLRQNYHEFEHIVIDGASKDNTLDIIKEYEARYDGRLRWISESDRGLYDAMNKGIAMATGDVVGILNSDDFYSSNNILTYIANEFNNPMLEAVYGDIHFVAPDNLNKCVRYYSSKGFRYWKMKMGFMPAHPSFYCRKQIFEWLGGFDTSYKVAADFEQLLRFLYKGGVRSKYLPIDFVTMRTGGASTSGIESHKKIFHDHMRAYAKNGVNSNVFFEGLRYVYKLIEVGKFKLGLK